MRPPMVYMLPMSRTSDGFVQRHGGFTTHDRVRVEHLCDPASPETQRKLHGIARIAMDARQSGATGYIGDFIPALSGRPEVVAFVMHDDEYTPAGFIGAYLLEELGLHNPAEAGDGDE